MELREVGVAKEEWESDRRRLEEQLRSKDEQLRIQEEEQTRLKHTFVSMFSVLILCVHMYVPLNYVWYNENLVSYTVEYLTLLFAFASHVHADQLTDVTVL